jgi:hypothetical protein
MRRIEGGTKTRTKKAGCRESPENSGRFTQDGKSRTTFRVLSCRGRGRSATTTLESLSQEGQATRCCPLLHKLTTSRAYSATMAEDTAYDLGL